MINPIRMRPHVCREVRAIEEESKRVEVKTKGEREIFVDKANADLLGSTESASGLEDKEEGLKAREERERCEGGTSIAPETS